MALTGAQAARLEELLFRAVVRVSVGPAQGSGFVVAPGRVLTARHVVERALTGEVLTVTDSAGVASPASVTEHRGPGWPDLALLAVPDAAALPAVLLDATPTPRDQAERLVAGGYPAGSAIPYQSRGFASGGETNFVLPDDGGPVGAYLRLDGDPLVGGMSGGPVLDLTTGFVVGVVRRTMDAGTDVGGFALPVAAVLGQLPALGPVHERPGPAAAEWVGLLGPVHLKAHRRAPDGTWWDAGVAPTPRLDLRVTTGTPSPDRWTVTVAEPASTATVTVGDLGGGVMEALDRWSRRRLLESRAETELLGRLLGRALLPPPLSHLLPRSGLVRIQVDRDDRLAAIPWEYARTDAGKPLATDPALAFSRFVDVPGVPVLPKETLRVLGVTICPPAVAARLPARVTRGGQTRLTGGAQLGDDLARSVRGRGTGRTPLELTVASDVSLDEFDRLLRDDGPWDVVHYLGLGWEFDDGDECTLAFADGPDVVPAPLSSVIDKLVEHRCPLVVVQLLSAPMDRPGPALGSLRLLPLLDGGVQAFVVAQHAATNQHVTGFGTAFYERLAAGEPVEAAAQRARRSLLDSPPQLDYTAFGTVTVTTTRDGDLRLVSPAPAATGVSRGGLPGVRSPR